MQPTEEDIKKWEEIAKRRSAVLPWQFEFISKKDISNDPVDWNMHRK